MGLKLAAAALVGMAFLAGFLAGKERVPRDLVAEQPAEDVASKDDDIRKGVPTSRAKFPARQAQESAGQSADTADHHAGEALSMLEGLRLLRSRVEEPLVAVDLEAGLQERYQGFEPRDFLQVYPLLSETLDREMSETLRGALESGNYLSEWLQAGQPIDLDKYKDPGETFQTVASQTEPLGNGLVEHRIVPITRARFPEMYARNYEEIWVHERIDSAGICTLCDRPPPANVKVTRN